MLFDSYLVTKGYNEHMSTAIELLLQDICWVPLILCYETSATAHRSGALSENLIHLLPQLANTTTLGFSCNYLSNISQPARCRFAGRWSNIDAGYVAKVFSSIVRRRSTSAAKGEVLVELLRLQDRRYHRLLKRHTARDDDRVVSWSQQHAAAFFLQFRRLFLVHVTKYQS